MTDTLAYADGYGRWHVLARDTPQGLTRAVNTIMRELYGYVAYHDAARDYVNRNIVSLPLADWDDSPMFGGPVPDGDWLHFAEYAID